MGDIAVIYEQVNKFVRYIINTYKPKKITRKIGNYYLYDYNEFIKELKAQKVTLTLTDKVKFELMDLFVQEKNKIVSLIKEVKEIDKLVYSLYGLKDDDIKLIENKL